MIFRAEHIYIMLLTTRYPKLSFKSRWRSIGLELTGDMKVIDRSIKSGLSMTTHSIH